MPDKPVNVMDQYQPNNFCNPASAKYRDRYAAIARHATGAEISAAHAHADRRGLHYVTITHERGGRQRLWL